MAVKRSVVEAPTEKTSGDGVMNEDKSRQSPGRGVRADGSGSTSPHNRAARAGEGAVPSRQLDIRSY